MFDFPPDMWYGLTEYKLEEIKTTCSFYRVKLSTLSTDRSVDVSLLIIIIFLIDVETNVYPKLY